MNECRFWNKFPGICGEKSEWISLIRLARKDNLSLRTATTFARLGAACVATTRPRATSATVGEWVSPRLKGKKCKIAVRCH